MIRHLLAAAVLLPWAVPAQAQRLSPLETREMELALAAAPAHLKESSEVRILREGRYVVVRPGSNGFTCLVEHEHPATTEPVCYDAAGSRSFLPVADAREGWRRAGVGEAEIKRRIREGFASGRFKAPDRPGMAYMLSPEQTVVDEASGEVVPYIPHLMFYAPNLSAADLGLESPEVAAPANRPFLVFEQDPRGLVILPLAPHR
jgi:hypothetical protein